jgi:hypothetical protein
VGISELLGQQRQLGEPVLESDNVLQDAGTSDTLQVLPGFQEEISRGLQYIPDHEFLDKWQLHQELPVDRNAHLLGAAEKSGEYLQPDEKRLQFRVRVDDQLAGWLAHQTENVAEEGSFRLRRFRQRFGSEQFPEQHIARLQSANVSGTIGKIHRILGEIVRFHRTVISSSISDRGDFDQKFKGRERSDR